MQIREETRVFAGTICASIQNCHRNSEETEPFTWKDYFPPVLGFPLNTPEAATEEEAVAEIRSLKERLADSRHS